MERAGTTLLATARVVAMLGWLNLLGGPLAGLILAFSKDSSGDRPYAVIGLTLAAVSVVYGSAILMVTSYVQWRTLWSRHTVSS